MGQNVSAIKSPGALRSLFNATIWEMRRNEEAIYQISHAAANASVEGAYEFDLATNKFVWTVEGNPETCFLDNVAIYPLSYGVINIHTHPFNCIHPKDVPDTVTVLTPRDFPDGLIVPSHTDLDTYMRAVAYYKEIVVNAVVSRSTVIFYAVHPELFDELMSFSDDDPDIEDLYDATVSNFMISVQQMVNDGVTDASTIEHNMLNINGIPFKCFVASVFPVWGVGRTA